MGDDDADELGDGLKSISSKYMIDLFESVEDKVVVALYVLGQRGYMLADCKCLFRGQQTLYGRVRSVLV